MILSLFIFGLMAGAVLGVPVGPNGTLCLYRSMRFGWVQGIATAFGSVTAMFLHAFISFMLLSLIMGFLSQSGGREQVDLLGGFVSIAIGMIFACSSSKGKSSLNGEALHNLFFRNFISSFAIGAVNPKNIFGFAALLVADNITLKGNPSSVADALSFGSGVFLSTAALFFILIYLSITIGERFLSSVIPWLKYCVSAVFILTGVLKILSLALK